MRCDSPIAQHVAGGDKKWALADIALGESTAGQIANVFFGLCRDAAAFTGDEGKIATRLEAEVSEAILTRKDIAHGDWRIGWLGAWRTCHRASFV